MRRNIWVLGLVALLASTGCSVSGKWSVTSVEPTAARRDFPYDVVMLEKDGSFYAETHEPRATTTSGTYRYEDGVLSFREHGGELNTFKATRRGNEKLELERPWSDRLLVATLERKD